MKTLPVLFGLIMTHIFATSAFSQVTNTQKQCEVPPVDQKKINGITKVYEQRYSELASQSKKEIDDAKKEAPRNGSIGIDSHIETRSLKFKLHIPEVTMQTQAVSIDLPEVKTNTRKFSSDVPTVITGQDCRRGPDEIVTEWHTCRNDVPPFDYPCSETRTRPGVDICLPTIKTEMRREEVSLDVPEVKLVRQDWKLNVPTVKMVLQEMSMDYPVLIVDNVTVKQETVKKKAKEAQTNSKSRQDKVTAAMKQEIKAVIIAPIEASFKCSLASVEEEEKKAMALVTPMLDAYEAGYKKALDTKNAEVIATFSKALQALKAAREKTLEGFVKARAGMEAERRKKLATL